MQGEAMSRVCMHSSFTASSPAQRQEYYLGASSIVSRDLFRGSTLSVVLTLDPHMRSIRPSCRLLDFDTPEDDSALAYAVSKSADAPKPARASANQGRAHHSRGAASSKEASAETERNPQEPVHAPPPNIARPGPATPSASTTPRPRTRSPVKKSTTTEAMGAASPTAPNSPPVFEDLHAVPGGIPSSQPVFRTPVPAPSPWPVMDQRRLLTNAAVRAWVDSRCATTAAELAAARAHHNDFFVWVYAHTNTFRQNFSREYAMSKDVRRIAMLEGIHDMQRAFYTVEAVTGALIITAVISPQAAPSLFRRMDDRDDTIVRVEDPSKIKFQYFHVGAPHRTDGKTIAPQWQAAYDELADTIKTRFAKPHIEMWGRHRKAAGHQGTLSGSLQQFADEPDDDLDNEYNDMFASRAPVPLAHEPVAEVAQDTGDDHVQTGDNRGALMHAFDVIEARAKDSRLEILLEELGCQEEERHEILSLAVTLESTAFFDEVVKLDYSTRTAAQMLYLAELDKEQDVIRLPA
ncbi:hypothetical protein EXIGLDRAFT_707041 [Exidia glandulosa HHB12029]|uniref:Uncharacterized protein n=1 Tax=Exidia glandulosa HHB12029 TaxID=1314781 RepID=A0A165Z566_EXIGL|nr:hypothetical protein EXIGLDRAFT_707041 [Exidia glandulosa HHB12029]